MKTTIFTTVAAAAVFAVPAAAQAQAQDAAGEGFIAATAGIHKLNIEDDVQAQIPGADFDDSGEIFGVAAGYDFPLGTSLFGGIEGNYSFGSGALDADYGASLRLGTRLAGGTKLYVRGGYQVIEVDYNAIIGDDSVDFGGIDDTEGDYLVGAGVDVPVGGAFIRGNVDTIAFDTLRATVGVGLRF